MTAALSDLIARLEQATEGSRELDIAIRDSLGLPAMLVPPDGGDEAQPYTSSIDQALTLVPEGWQWELSNNAIDRGQTRSIPPDNTVSELGPWASLQLPPKGEDGNNDWFGIIRCAGAGAATVPLAVCAAALRARAASQHFNRAPRIAVPSAFPGDLTRETPGASAPGFLSSRPARGWSAITPFGGLDTPSDAAKSRAAASPTNFLSARLRKALSRKIFCSSFRLQSETCRNVSLNSSSVIVIWPRFVSMSIATEAANVLP